MFHLFIKYFPNAVLLSCAANFFSRTLLQSEKLVMGVGRVLPFHLASEMKL